MIKLFANVKFFVKETLPNNAFNVIWPKFAWIPTVPFSAVAVTLSLKELKLVNGLTTQSSVLETTVSLLADNSNAWEPTLNAISDNVRLTPFNAVL